MEQMVTEFVKQFPVAGVCGVFAWALYRLIKQVLDHYQATLTGVLKEILDSLHDLNGGRREG